MVRPELERHAEELFFSQRNGEPWEHLPYWDAMIDYRACGLVSMTHCIDVLTGKDLTPADVYHMRAAYGVDQSRVASKDGTGICGGDAQFQFNEMNRKLFGVESRPLERTVSALREALMQEDTVIWASSRNTDFYSMDGSVRTSRNGHVMCFWKYENGVFFAKDSGLTKEQGNNVPYDEERMGKWLGGWTYQQFIIGLAK